MTELWLRNRQRVYPIQTAPMRRIARTLLEQLLKLPEYHLGIVLTAAPEMAKLNEQFLQHSGPTDVITFDYAEGFSAGLHGEIFLCVEVAREQARLFHTHWTEELVRYLVHGVLHLRGYDDHSPFERRTMKREENRLLKELAGQFNLRTMARRLDRRKP